MATASADGVEPAGREWQPRAGMPAAGRRTPPAAPLLAAHIKTIRKALKALQPRAAGTPMRREPADLEALERLRLAVDGLQALHHELRNRRAEGRADPGADRGGHPLALNAGGGRVTERQQTADASRQRLAFEQLLTTISRSLIHLSLAETVREINGALKAIGEFVGADRSYIIGFAEDGTRRLLHEWCTAGVTPLMHEFNDAPLDAFPAWLQSGLEVPMVSGTALIGSLGVSSQSERTWTEDDIRLLKIAGEIFVNALHRQRAERARTELEERLRQSQKLDAVGRLAGGIAHDFNNQLTIIKGCAQFLLAGLAPDDPRRADAQRISTTVDRGAHLVRQLLAFSSAHPSARQTVDLSQLVEEMAPMLRLLLGEQITLQVNPAPGLWRIRADPVQIERVVMNLVANAKDAMGDTGDGAPAGTVTLETANIATEPGDNPMLDGGAPRSAAAASAAEQPAVETPARLDGYVMLAVTDTGCGMTADVRKRMFEPYFSTKPFGKGTGLGLSTAFAVVKQHGGYITCDTQSGKGTTFKIYLPRTESDVGALPLYPPAEPPIRVGHSAETDTGQPIRSKKKATVLVAEDEEGVREVVRQILEGAGYRVHVAGAVEEALMVAAILDEPIDLLVSDIAMPGGSGRALARCLLPAHPGMRTLFISAYPRNWFDGSAPPNARFLQKPFDPDLLLQHVWEMLRE